MFKQWKRVALIGCLAILVGILSMSASAYTAYCDCSKTYEIVSIYGPTEGNDGKTHNFNCRATFNKGSLVQADSASSYLYFDNSSYFTIDNVEVEMVFENGKRTYDNNKSLASTPGLLWQKTVNVYHRYKFIGSTSEEHQTIRRFFK